MQSDEIRRRFLEFFEKRGHTVVPSASLVPENDPSVLLTSAGMQQFKPYFTSLPAGGSPCGENVASVQKCFRTSDIESVGDESHLTFFEMLGNFSFGGYGKEEAIKYAYDFLQELHLTIDYISVFGGDGQVPEDQEAAAIWEKLGIKDIRRAGRADNFWGPTGREGPCGPTTEIYLRGTEIWNIVFNEYYQNADGKLEKLPKLGIDTGMGLERLAMIVQKKANIFETDLFVGLMKRCPDNFEITKRRRIADHVRAVCFLIVDGVRPSNKGAGYILRRLLRLLLSMLKLEKLKILTDTVAAKYYIIPDYKSIAWGQITDTILAEHDQFSVALNLGLKELSKLSILDITTAFKLFESYGLPFELMKEKFPTLDRAAFDVEFAKHQSVSRAGATGKFAGGLADHEPATIKLHTAHHLLLAALQKVLGPQVKQRGSNITQERLRLDFSHGEKLSPEQLKQVEDLVNEKIGADLTVERREMAREEAEKLGAEREFGGKYGERVSVYLITDRDGAYFSKEFCGGPHAARTGELGRFCIIKEEAVAAGVRRIKAVLDKKY